MKYLVTGGAGFIGSNIVHELVKRKEEVIVVDNLVTGRVSNLNGVQDDITLVGGDIAEIDFMKSVLKDVDVVLHHAALPSVPRSIDNPSLSHRHNALGTLNLLTAAREAGVKRFVYASSSSVYGNRPQKHKIEFMKPQPLSPYAAQKLMGEYYCKVFAHLYDMSTICLRYFNVFGPRQNPASAYAAVIPKFITSILKDKKPVIYGNGTQTRDFTFVENNIHANILAAKAKRIHYGETVNIATGSSYSLLQLVQIINGILGTKVKPVFKDERQGDVMHSLAKLDKAKMLIGYEPIVDFEEGVRRTVDWFREKA